MSRIKSHIEIVLVLIFIFTTFFGKTEGVAQSDSTSCCYVSSYPLAPNNRLRSTFLLSAMNPINGDLYVYDRVSSDILRIQENGEVDLFANYLLINPEDMLSWMQVSPDGTSLFFAAGDFGSDVIMVDIQTKEILHEYNFKPERSMIGFSQIVTKDQTVYKMGGYGYWDYRNIMLEWSPDKPEWKVTKTTGELPPRGDPPNLYYLEESDELFYIVHPMLENSTNSQVQNLEFYRFDLQGKRWSKVGESQYEYPIPFGMNFHRVTRSQAVSPDYLHVINNVFLKRSDLKLYYSDLDIYNVIKGSTAFYSKRLGKRILLAEANTSDQRELFIRLVDEKDLKLLPFLEKKAGLTSWIVFGLVLFGAMITGLTTYWVQHRKQEPKLSDARFLIEKTRDERLNLFVKGEKISLSDPNLRRLWELIYYLKKENQSEIYLSDLDQHLFLNSSNAALNSRTRGKLFKVVREMAEEPMITIEQSPTDKRYKIVRFNLGLIKIVESD